MSDIILGLSAYYHDAAAVLIRNGHIVAAAQEERFSRVKHDAGFPANAARFVLDRGGVSLADLACVAFYDKPRLKLRRLIQTYLGFAPQGFRSFATSIPMWFGGKMDMQAAIYDRLAELGAGTPDILFPEHHLSHAASAFYPSPFEEAAILTVDGVGEWATTTICKGVGADITVLKELRFPHSLGLLYSAFTAFCGFRVNSGEYKLMGLAPYGNPDSPRVARWKQAIRDELVDVREDGSLYLNMDYFNYATGTTMCAASRWESLFGIRMRPQESEITQAYMDLALAIQQVTEEVVSRLAETARAITGCRNLVMAGGVALNCVANGKLLRQGVFDDIWVQPAAGDAGGALGAALAAHHIGRGRSRTVRRPDAMEGAYLGPEFGGDAVERMVHRHGASCTRYDDFSALADNVADLLAQGRVVGWFQGRMEYGPRALGNRSILGDPRHPEMQKKLNLKIKYREGFRPFAPSVMEEELDTWFDLDRPSPYMLMVAPVAGGQRSPLPDGYEAMPMYDRLYVQRSTIPAVTHVDNSARIQSVSRATNPRYWELISTFSRRHGCGLVVNTSFNVRGEPIVCTPEDAYACFMRTEMDCLVIGDHLFHKQDQPPWEETADWRELFALD